MKVNAIVQKFEELFHASPLVIRSPGRINLIGEHTDYNDGFVLPAAIDKEIFLALAKNETGNCRVYSYDYKEEISFSLNDFAPAPGGWINYIMGVVAQVIKGGHQVEGFDCVFGGNIPIGAGLSSSAALENAVGFGISELFDLKLDRVTLLKYSQKAEHEYAGVACGIMDQFASMMGRADHALRLDCRSLDYNYFPLDLGNYQFILCDTKVEHALADSEYNQRRKECEVGLSAVQRRYPGINSLRDVTLQMLDSVRMELPLQVWEKCLYVLEENERLLKGCQMLESGDLQGFGQMMYGSHEGLSRKYQVSCPELDFLVDFTKDKPGVLGARMMGGGFGGCTINLVQKDTVEAFEAAITAAYQKKFDRLPEIYKVHIVDGTSRLAIEE